MKKHLLFYIVLFLLATASTHSFAQNHAFATKLKSGTSRGFTPKPLLPVPGLSITTSRPAQATSFSPVAHPLPSFAKSGVQNPERHYNQHGQVVFLAGKLASPASASLKSAGQAEAACFEYLSAIRGELRIQDPNAEFRTIETKTDDLGMSHYKMQQVYQGIPVYGGEIYLHSSGDQIGLFNGNPYPTPVSVAVTPSASSYQAEMAVIADVSGRTAFYSLSTGQKEMLKYNGPVSELVIYHKDRNPRQPFLAWHVTIRPNFAERWEYFIDARTGAVIHYYNNTHHDGDVTATGPDLNGVNRTIHAYQQGSSFLMVDISKPMYNPQNLEGTLRTFDANFTSPSLPGFNPPICSSANNTWQPAVYSSQYNAGVTYEYFRTVHNRNSWNNQGGSIISVINATEDNGSGMDNAYWNGVCIVYGNGGSQFKPLGGALDVSAHEIGHAFDEASANLEYQNQSGAMNEAFSDIAAAVVERQNWKIGEDVVKPGAFPTGCLRDMSNPHNGGSSLSDPGYQPAHVSEMYTGTQDNGGVHINSGIINLAFYKYVTSVGMVKGENTFFRALFNYLTRSSQFIDCRLAVVQSAKDLYGDGSAEVNAAKAAFDAVGIMDGSGGNYQNQLPVNPGQDYILAYNTDPADPNSLYISNTGATNFIPISQTQLANKPSIVDNGSVAVFIGTDKMMHAITLGSQIQETIIENEAIWSNVAISKDGSMIAAVTEYQDSAIYIYSYQKQQWVKAHLYNPTTQQGVITNNVLYADALEWDYSGEFIMYDAYNQMNSPTPGQDVDYWDISFMHIWNKTLSDWGTGEVYKLVSGIPEGVSIGNPSLSKNSPVVCAFDYMDAASNSVTIVAANLETGEFVDVYNNGSTLGYPNYSKLDDQIIFSSEYNLDPVIRTIPMAADKIHPASATASPLIGQAKWGVWYAQGNRPLGVAEAAVNTELNIFPNPARDQVTVSLKETKPGTCTFAIYDTRGRQIRSVAASTEAGTVIDLSGMAPGLYLLKASGKDFSVTRKLVVE